MSILKESNGSASAWAHHAAFYRWLGRFEASASGVAGEAHVAPKQAARRLSEGRPLLQWEDLALDWERLRESISEVLASVAEHFPALAETARDAQAVLLDSVMLQRVVRSCYNGRSVPRAATVGRKSKARGEVLRLAAKVALRPFLCAQRQKLLSLVPVGRWRRGTCPVCGGLPDLSYLDREWGTRWLVCGRCDAQWVFQRLQCPYCQCTDQESLSYLTDSTGLYRLYFCDECRSYLKALDLRAWQAEVEPVGQRAETLDLDRQARQRGFRCPDSLASLAA